MAVSSVGRTADSDSEGDRFEPYTASYTPVAQWRERNATNVGHRGGSSPFGCAANADVAQLVAHLFRNQTVASSSLVISLICGIGAIGERTRLISERLWVQVPYSTLRNRLHLV